MRFGFGKKDKREPQSPIQDKNPNKLRKSISQYVRPGPGPNERRESKAVDDSALGRRGTLITAEAGLGKSLSIDESRPRRGTLITDWQDLDKTHIIPQKPEQPPLPQERRLSRAAVHVDNGDHPKIEQLKSAQREAQARAARRRSSIAAIEAAAAKDSQDSAKARRQSSSRLRKYASHNLLRSRANSFDAPNGLKNVNAGKEVRVSVVPKVPPMPEKYAQEIARPSTTIERPADQREAEHVTDRSSVTGAASKSSEEKSPVASSPSNSSPSSDDSFGALDLQGVTSLPSTPSPDSDLAPRPLTPPKATLSLEIPTPLERHSSTRSFESTRSLKSNKSAVSEKRGSRAPYVARTPTSSIRSLSRRLTNSPPLHGKADGKDLKLACPSATNIKRVSENSMEFVCRGPAMEDDGAICNSNDGPVEQTLQQSFWESRGRPRGLDDYYSYLNVDPPHEQQIQSCAEEIQRNQGLEGRTAVTHSSKHNSQNCDSPARYSLIHCATSGNSPNHLSPSNLSADHVPSTYQSSDQYSPSGYPHHQYSRTTHPGDSCCSLGNRLPRSYSTAATHETIEEIGDEEYDALYQQYAQSTTDYSPQSPQIRNPLNAANDALHQGSAETLAVHGSHKGCSPSDLTYHQLDDFIESPVDKHIHQYPPIPLDSALCKEVHQDPDHGIAPKVRTPSPTQCILVEDRSSLPENLRLPRILRTSYINPDKVFQEVLSRLQ